MAISGAGQGIDPNQLSIMQQGTGAGPTVGSDPAGKAPAGQMVTHKKTVSAALASLKTQATKIQGNRISLSNGQTLEIDKNTDLGIFLADLGDSEFDIGSDFGLQGHDNLAVRVELLVSNFMRAQMVLADGWTFEGGTELLFSHDAQNLTSIKTASGEEHPLQSQISKVSIASSKIFQALVGVKVEVDNTPPAAPAGPTGPTGPAKPAKPAKPAGPTGPAKPADPPTITDTEKVAKQTAAAAKAYLLLQEAARKDKSQDQIKALTKRRNEILLQMRRNEGTQGERADLSAKIESLQAEMKEGTRDVKIIQQELEELGVATSIGGKLAQGAGDLVMGATDALQKGVSTIFNAPGEALKGGLDVSAGKAMMANVGVWGGVVGATVAVAGAPALIALGIGAGIMGTAAAISTVNNMREGHLGLELEDVNKQLEEAGVDLASLNKDEVVDPADLADAAEVAALADSGLAVDNSGTPSTLKDLKQELTSLKDDLFSEEMKGGVDTEKMDELQQGFDALLTTDKALGEGEVTALFAKMGDFLKGSGDYKASGESYEVGKQVRANLNGMLNNIEKLEKASTYSKVQSDMSGTMDMVKLAGSALATGIAIAVPVAAPVLIPVAAGLAGGAVGGLTSQAISKSGDKEADVEKALGDAKLKLGGDNTADQLLQKEIDRAKGLGAAKQDHQLKKSNAVKSLVSTLAGAAAGGAAKALDISHSEILQSASEQLGEISRGSDWIPDMGSAPGMSHTDPVLAGLRDYKSGGDMPSNAELGSKGIHLDKGATLQPPSSSMPGGEMHVRFGDGVAYTQDGNDSFHMNLVASDGKFIPVHEGWTPMGHDLPQSFNKPDPLLNESVTGSHFRGSSTTDVRVGDGDNRHSIDFNHTYSLDGSGEQSANIIAKGGELFRVDSGGDLHQVFVDPDSGKLIEVPDGFESQGVADQAIPNDGYFSDSYDTQKDGVALFTNDKGDHFILEDGKMVLAEPVEMSNGEIGYVARSDALEGSNALSYIEKAGKELLEGAAIVGTAYLAFNALAMGGARAAPALVGSAASSLARAGGAVVRGMAGAAAMGSAAVPSPRAGSQGTTQMPRPPATDPSPPPSATSQPASSGPRVPYTQMIGGTSLYQQKLVAENRTGPNGLLEAAVSPSNSVFASLYNTHVEGAGNRTGVAHGQIFGNQAEPQATYPVTGMTSFGGGAEPYQPQEITRAVPGGGGGQVHKTPVMRGGAASKLHPQLRRGTGGSPAGRRVGWGGSTNWQQSLRNGAEGGMHF